jgi:hypothetical protein
MKEAKIDSNLSQNKSLNNNTFKATLSFDGNEYEVTIDSK